MGFLEWRPGVLEGEQRLGVGEEGYEEEEKADRVEVGVVG